MFRLLGRRWYSRTMRLSRGCRVCWAVVSVAGGFFIPETSLGDVHYVGLQGRHQPPFTNWWGAATNIQAAVDVASAGDTVLVTNGTYSTGGKGIHAGMTNRIAVTKPVVVRSMGDTTGTVVRGISGFGGTPMRCVYLTNGAVLAGFTVTDGVVVGGLEDESGQGGGVRCEPDGVVSNCILSRNSAAVGGGGFGGVFLHCQFIGNWAQHGGGAGESALRHCTLTANHAGTGICGAGGGTYGCVLDDCVLIHNTVSGVDGYVQGGGAYGGVLRDCRIEQNAADGLLGGAMTAFGEGGGVYGGVLTNCWVVRNRASGPTVVGYGGGICDGMLHGCVVSNNESFYGGGVAHGPRMNGGGLVISRCIFNANRASDGGGACCDIFTDVFDNCLFVGNRADSYGGGVHGGVLINCTLSANAAGVSGGGACNVALRNCIVYGNTSGQDDPNLWGFGNVEFSWVPNWDRGNGPPLFVDAASGDYRLSVASPCLDAGNNALAVGSVDLRGNPRIMGSSVDVGAYEQPPIGASPLHCRHENGISTVLSWQTVLDRRYLLHATTNLSRPNWSNVCSVTGDGFRHAVTGSLGEARQRFFRLSVATNSP
jgi:hypothetical protein